MDIYVVSRAIYKTETGQAKESRLVVPRGWCGEWDVQGVEFLDANCYIWNGWAMGPTIQHRELCVIGSFRCTTEIEETL